MKRKLQVFVSSTYSDLLPERQAAVAAILKASHIPAGMELFAAGDRSQLAIIKQWIDESDVYMLILGGRYGSVDPTSGISYTELEYDYAVQQSKPLFAVVINEAALEDKVRAGGTKYMEKENPKELVLFRKKVLSNVSSFFDDAKDIKLCVHESLADLAASRDLKGWVSADEIVDTKPFFDEIRKLSEENRQLKESLAEQETRSSSKTSKQAESFKDLRKVLSAIKVKIPASLTSDKEEKEHDLLSLFYRNKETFITGVTNAASSNDDVEIFYFYNVCPKLQVHGLTVNEKVAGVRYRRYAVTHLGSAFLADMERRLVLKESSRQQQAPTQVASPEASPPPAKKTRRAKPAAKRSA
jgi:hypothetical protein